MLTVCEKEISFFISSFAPKPSRLRSKISDGFLFLDQEVLIVKLIRYLFGGREE